MYVCVSVACERISKFNNEFPISKIYACEYMFVNFLFLSGESFSFHITKAFIAGFLNF